MPVRLLSPPALHIPDGFLNIPIALAFWIATIAVVGLAVRKSRSGFDERSIPLMGIMAAFIFAGQMINFPIAGGTSGHLLGGVLAAVTLGPWGGMLVMATVIGVQALVFQDGGLLALGANIFNMGILTVVIGYGLTRLTAGRTTRAQLAAAGPAAWLSVLAGALFTALQLWLSGVAALAVVLPVMLGVHALIGLGEALITVFALGFIFRTRPELPAAAAASSNRSWAALGIAASLFVLALAPLASSNPDGLERVAGDLGFLSGAQDAAYNLLPDYTLPWLGDSAVSTVAAGFLGAVIVAALAFGFAAHRRNKRSGA